MKYRGSDKIEAQRDDYTKEDMPIRESVSIAVDQCMSRLYTGLDGRGSFAGIGPGVMLGSKKEMTAKEFCQMMRERREAVNGICDRSGPPRLAQ